MNRAGRHHLDLLASADASVNNTHVGHDTAVGVVDRVKDHRARRRISVADRSGHGLDYALQDFLHPKTGLRGGEQHVGGIAADDARKLSGVLLGLRRREIDLVEYRNDHEVVLKSQVQVGKRLGLNALRSIDQQDRALAGCQGARDLVGEVDVAGGIDHVQDVLDSIGGDEGQTNGLALDGDAPLALDIHPVEVLGPHLAGVNDARLLQHPIGQGGLSVVDVGDDAEIPDHRGIGGTRLLEGHGCPHEGGPRGGHGGQFGSEASLRLI